MSEERRRDEWIKETKRQLSVLAEKWGVSELQPITGEEIEAGAHALAAINFWQEPQWPLSRFSSHQQREFRKKALAVLEAARIVRESTS